MRKYRESADRSDKTIAFFFLPKEPIWLTIFGNYIKRFDFLFFSSKFTTPENSATGPSAAAMRLHRAECHCLSRHALRVRRLLARGIMICMSRTSRLWLVNRFNFRNTRVSSPISAAVNQTVEFVRTLPKIVNQMGSFGDKRKKIV